MKARRILVFSPHPDDEIIGCGGTLAIACANGAKVKVIVITDGEKGLIRDQLSSIRREECVAGLDILGIEDVVFWGYPDQQIPLSGSIIENYKNSVLEFRPDYIFLPSPSELHADHRRVTRGILKALEDLWKGHLFFYETTQPVLINTTREITSVIELKRLALMAHASQMEQFNYEELCISITRLRGLSIGKDYAESFLTFLWDGSRQNFFETRPLISVIVRADNLLYLRNALLSLISQHYDQIEVLLVWHGDDEIDLKEFDYIDFHILQGTKGRGYNFNLGLSVAKGEYIAFLDQDDILYPDHLELLLSHLHGNNNYDIVYSGCKVVHCDLQEGNPVILHEEISLNRDYHPGRLLIGNYIPIHSLLFRNVIFRCHRFDEELTAYEDWEMLARLEMCGYRFLHMDNITCEYRLYGQDGLNMEQLHINKGYLSQNKNILKKIFERMGFENLNQLSSLVSGIESEINNLKKLSAEQKEQNNKIQEKLEGCASIETLLLQGMAAAHIKGSLHSGLLEMIARLLSGESLFSIILSVYNTPLDILEETILSVKKQIYSGWELCLVDDASDRTETLELLSSLEKDAFFEGKLHYLYHKKREGIVAALKDAIDMAQSPYLVFLDHDDVLHDEALLTLALTLKSEKMYAFLYTDSRTIDLAGRLLHIYHKPKWSPDSLLHGNYINHLMVVRRDIFNQVRGFRKKYEGAQDLDLLLRVSSSLKDNDVRHINVPLYDWRASSDSVAYSCTNKPYVFNSARRAIADHLTRKKFENVKIEKNPQGTGFCCNWETNCQGIDIIIPTKNNLPGLKTCIEGLFQATDYPFFSVTIVSNNSSSAAMMAYLDILRKKERIHIIIDNRPFNWAALNNSAVAESSAPILLFLNDDIEFKDRKWLLNMTKYLMLDGVGAVGATLYYPDGSLQHNGIMTDEKFVARNITSWGKRRELTTTRNVSAVTGACLLLARKTFELTGGLDESLPRSYNDVDLCLNIRSKGLRIIQAVDVQLVHHESETCGEVDSIEKKEEWERSSAFMRNKWGKELQEKYLASCDVFAQYTKIVHVC
jgi:glycosyltransferase involved in cell wall biosynthesis/LmbE family N-acetylglucosaminyl deacetylase